MILVALFSVITAIIVAVIANGDIISMISAIISGVGAVGSLAAFVLGKDADKKKVIGFSALLISVSFLALFGWLHYFNQPPPPPHTWTQALQKFDPGCNDNSWKVPSQDNSEFSCPGTGLLVQQTKQQGGAEVDLEQVNGTSYSQTTFRVQVQVRFQSSNGQSTSDPNTVAELLVQTPPTLDTYGGYVFGLNDTGFWQLKSVPSQGADVVVASGSMQVDTSKPIKLEVDVQNNQVTGFINGQQVVQQSDTLNPSPGVIGLVVEWSTTNITTQVLFNDFELDL